jgi:hypothetical protein
LSNLKTTIFELSKMGRVAMAIQRKQNDNNKFVAFAFASADSFLEIDIKGQILFESGISLA